MNYAIIVILMLLHATVGWTQSIQQDLPMTDLRRPQLAARNLAIYEQQAILKLRDVLDYVSLIGSSQYDATMRATATESVEAAFDGEALIACNWVLTTEKEGATCSLTTLLQTLLNKAPAILQIEAKNIRIKQGLKQQSETEYTGQLIYQQLVSVQKTPTETAQKTKQNIILDFTLKRIVKQFGTDQDEVWEVQFLSVKSKVK